MWVSFSIPVVAWGGSSATVVASLCLLGIVFDTQVGAVLSVVVCMLHSHTAGYRLRSGDTSEIMAHHLSLGIVFDTRGYLGILVFA